MLYLWYSHQFYNREAPDSIVTKDVVSRTIKQVIGRHNIDYVAYTGPSLLRGRIALTRAISLSTIWAKMETYTQSSWTNVDPWRVDE